MNLRRIDSPERFKNKYYDLEKINITENTKLLIIIKDPNKEKRLRTLNILKNKDITWHSGRDTVDVFKNGGGCTKMVSLVLKNKKISYCTQICSTCSDAHSCVFLKYNTVKVY